jgi:hypothetical protein
LSERGKYLRTINENGDDQIIPQIDN